MENGFSRFWVYNTRKIPSLYSVNLVQKPVNERNLSFEEIGDKNVENSKQCRESKACPLVYQRGHREDSDTEWSSKA